MPSKLVDEAYDHRYVLTLQSLQEWGEVLQKEQIVGLGEKMQYLLIKEGLCIQVIYWKVMQAQVRNYYPLFLNSVLLEYTILG